MKNKYIILIFVCFVICVAAINNPSYWGSIYHPHKYKLYKTKNFFNSLLLETETGQLWQVQFSLDNKGEEGILPISTDIKGTGPVGRFVLTSTGNMWTYIMTDTSTGNVWHCQFSVTNDERFCTIII